MSEIATNTLLLQNCN